MERNNWNRVNDFLGMNPVAMSVLTAMLTALFLVVPLALIALPASPVRDVSSDYAQPLALATSVPGDPRPSGGVRCLSGANPCIESWYGRDIAIYSGSASTLSTRKFRVDGASGTVQHGGFEIWDPPVSITVTDGITNLTPLGSYQNLTAAGTVTVTSLITNTSVVVTGTVVSFINTSAQSIVLTNGTYLILPSAANLTLAQWDNVRLRFDGTRWIAIGSTNN